MLSEQKAVHGALAAELKSHLVNNLNDLAADGKTKSRCINGSGPDFHVNTRSGRVGSLHLCVGLGRVLSSFQ